MLCCIFKMEQEPKLRFSLNIEFKKSTKPQKCDSLKLGLFYDYYYFRS